MAIQQPLARLFHLREPIDQKRLFYIFLGVGVFVLFESLSGLPVAVDPAGNNIALSAQGQGAIALFLLVAIWWIFEVIPAGVTGIAVGILQVLLLIRPAKVAFGDFMDPAVLFIIGSLMLGAAFRNVGLTRRIAYAMLALIGENTRMIYLGCFLITALMTHVMAHTAVAATMFPILMAIYTLYDPDNNPSRFGRGLFVGMAFVAGAGSMVTLLGSARAVVAVGFYHDITGRTLDFVDLSFFMFPVGWTLVLLIWLVIMVACPPERKTIPGLREKARQLRLEAGPINRRQWFVSGVMASVLLGLFLQHEITWLGQFDKAGIVLAAGVIFFLFHILDVKDLEALPWNIIFLFAGAMSMGFCLWDTGAARWLAVLWLGLFDQSHWFVFTIGLVVLLLLLTNVIMNVAAIAMVLPIGLVVAPYLGVSEEVVLFASLAAAGCPFLLLIGAPPNAIAYESGKFTPLQFFKLGIPVTLLVLLVIAAAIGLLWPLMGANPLR